VPKAQPSDIFISYRRADSGPYANAIASALRRELPDREVFLDVDSIGDWELWAQRLAHELPRTRVLLAVIGPHWVEDKDGRRRLDDPTDWVRREIEAATYDYGHIAVKPVLVGGAPLPQETDIPETIHRLLDAQERHIDGQPWPDDAQFRDGVFRLAANIKEILNEKVSETVPDLLHKHQESLLLKHLRTITSSHQVPPALSRIIPDKYLNDAPHHYLPYYHRVETITPHLPYVELVNWCRDFAQRRRPRIDVICKGDDFQLGRWDDHRDQLREHALETFRREKPKTFDGPIVRISDAKATDSALQLTVQQARYFDQLRSNLVLDFQMKGPGNQGFPTLRHGFYSDYQGDLPALHDRRLANSLGVAALIFVRSRDQYAPYLVSRSAETAVMNVGGEWHCTASGVAEMRHGEAQAQSFYMDSIIHELEEEVGLLPEDLIYFQPVGFCRELLRGGKPQMFFIGVTALDLETLNLKQKNARKSVIREGGIVENTPMPWFRRMPKDVNDEAFHKLFHDRGFTIEAAACLYYYNKIREVGGDLDAQ